MKKITLIVLAVFLAATATFAQRLTTDRKVDMLKPLRTLSEKEMDTQKHQRIHPQSQARLTPAKAPRRAAIISDQPEGDEVLFSMDCDAYYAYWGYLFQTSVSGKVAKFVFNGEDVYWYNPNSLNDFSSWIKGARKDNAITFSLPQKVYDYPDMGYGLNSVLVSMSTYAPQSNQKLKMSYTNQELKMTTSLTANGTVLGLTYDDDNGWTGYGDYNIKFKRFTDEALVVPEGLSSQIYSITGETSTGDHLAYVVRVAFSGNDVYIQGIYDGLPDSWVKGTLDGDKVSFPRQYIGAGDYFQYLVAATTRTTSDGTTYTLSTKDIVFTYDPATKVFTADAPFLINAGTSSVNFAADFLTATIKPFVEVPATPSEPVWTEINEGGTSYFSMGYGWGSLSFMLSNLDEDGNYIVPEKLFYQIYTKSNKEVQPLTLYASDYMYQAEPEMTEIPYSYGDNWDIIASASSRTVYYYTIGAEAYGIQAIYRGGGEERRSPIVWKNVTGIGAELQPDAAHPAYPTPDPTNVGSSIAYSYYTGEGDVNQFGFGKPETYDVAIKLNREDMIWTLVQSITIPLMQTENISDVKVWLSSQLRVENGVNVPDLASVSVSNPEEGYVTVTLDKPYTIPAEGVYVGYSFTVDAVTSADDINAKPLAVVSDGQPGGFYIHASKDVVKWLDFADLFGTNALIQVGLGGASIKENAAALDAEMIYASTNQEKELDLTVINHGADGVYTLDVEYNVAGMTGTQHIDLDQPIEPLFGKTGKVKFTVPAIPQQGSYDLTIKAIKVNGNDNQDASPATTVQIGVLDVVPTHRAILEEYTGTWCGYCPRGFVGLEMMSKKYGLDFVGVSYHNGDPMEIMSADKFPSDIEGFPAAWIDRVRSTDAYCGDAAYGTFGIDKTWEAQCEVFSPVEIQATGSWTDDNRLRAQATATFPVGYSKKNYRFSFVIVENGLHGTSDSWAQSNYYSGQTGWPSNMNAFTSGDSYVSGLIFNDVAVAVSDYNGKGITGSMPTSLPENGTADYSIEFPASAIVNTSGESLIQDKEKFYVVAMVIDADKGTVVNAVKVKVGDSAIDDIEAVNAFDAKTTQYYDLSGRSSAAPQRGLNIRKVTYSDGTTRTLKEFK